jgi:hypothetical protein
MRYFIRLVAAATLLFATLAEAKPDQRRYTNSQMCRRMTRQIDHFENTVLPMAARRGNRLWANSTVQHIERLKNRRADRCPEYGTERGYLAKIKRNADRARAIAKAAAKQTVKYFSGGAF